MTGFYPNLQMARWALTVVLTMPALGVKAGEKILFSGRDGRKAQYHRSLNARPLFEPQAIAQEQGDGSSAADGIYSVPAMIGPEARLKQDKDDEDWAFQSTDESGAERVEKEILGEDEDLDEVGIKRSRVERFLEKERERDKGDDIGADRGRTSLRDRRRQERAAELSKLQSSILGGSTVEASIPTAGVREGAAATRAESGAASVGPAVPMGMDAVSGRAGMEFHRDHVSRLKQSLGVAAAPGVDPFGGSLGSESALSKGGLGGGAGARATGGGGMPRPDSVGAYPGSQGLGLMDLTTPAGGPQTLAPLARPESPSRPEPRERSGPVRIRKSKRDIF